VTTAKLIRDWTGLRLRDVAIAIKLAGLGELVEVTFLPPPLSLDEIRAVIIRQIKEHAS
jgi:hypothetical protein